MASLPRRLQNSSYNANELQGVGMSPTPTVSPNVQGDYAMFNTASPLLRKTTLVDNSSMLNTAAKCREYSGFDGLRRLQQDQKNSTYYDPGCGWMYKQGTGTTNPSINRGVFATYNGVPVMGRHGQPDELVGGGSITMDLQKAEQKASQAMAAGLGGGCASLSLLSASNAPYFGFCTTTNKIIPIDTSSGTPQARYNNPTNFQFNCASSNIITAAQASRPGGCPQNVTTFRPPRIPTPTVDSAPPPGSPAATGVSPMAPQGPPAGSPAATGVSPMREGFDNSDDPQSQFACQVPLTRDCLLQGIRNAGCTDQGSLVAALSANTNSSTYDTVLSGSSAYKYYASRANLPTSLFKDGTGVPTSQNAYDIFTALAAAAETPSSDPTMKGVHAAARDLCLQGGAFSNSYNFCAELTASTKIDSTNIACIQNLWRNAGGDSKGTSYPTLSQWNGKSVDSFTQFKNTLVANLNSSDKATQANAILQFIGTSTYAVQRSCDLTQVANTRGSETVWFYNGNAGFPVIMRCDLMMAKDSDVIPNITGPESLSYKYALGTPNLVSFTTAFEYRPTANNKLAFKATVDDGVMIGYNQNPFEGTNALDWGSWKTQGPTTYTSGAYTIDTTTPGSRNMFVIKYCQGNGPCAFNLSIAEDYTTPTNFVNVATSVPAKQNIYLTQEPLAPWMNYEVCSKPNAGLGTALGFFDTRWNGPTSAANVSGNTAANYKISFDTKSSGVVYQTDAALRSKVPGGKSYMSFTQSSVWQTMGMFAFSAFKTITLMVRPVTPTIPSNDGAILTHIGNGTVGSQGFQLGVNYSGTAPQFVLNIGRDPSTGAPPSQQAAPCVLNAWNLLVIQYIDTDGYGIRDFSMHACSYEAASLNPTVRAEMLTQMQTKRNATKPIRFPVSRKESDITKYAGFLYLGGLTSGSSFTGDIAWLHGFRNYIGSDSELDAEINQAWISRWAVPKYNSTVAPDPSGCGPMPAKNPEGGVQPPLPPVVVDTPAGDMGSPQNAVVVWQSCDGPTGGGWSKTFTSAGTYLSERDYPFDASYISVPAGFTAVLTGKTTSYGGTAGTGQVVTLVGPKTFDFCTAVPGKGRDGWNGFNDNVASIVVTNTGSSSGGGSSGGVTDGGSGTDVTIYSDCTRKNYSGQIIQTGGTMRLTLGVNTIGGGFWAGGAKGIDIPAGFMVIVRYRGFLGRPQELTFVGPRKVDFCTDSITATHSGMGNSLVNTVRFNVFEVSKIQGFRNQSQGPTQFQPDYARNNQKAYVAQQEPKSVAASFFELFKW